MQRINQIIKFLVIPIGIMLAIYSCNSKESNTPTQQTTNYSEILKPLIQKAKNLKIEDDPKYFVEFYDSVNMFLTTVPNTVRIKIELRFALKNKMRDIGIVNEAIRQTTLSLHEIRNPDFNDSISLTLMLYGQLAGLYTALNQTDSVTLYQTKSILLSKHHGVVLHQAPPLNNRGIFFLDHQMPDSAISYFLLADSILRHHKPLTAYWNNFHHSVLDNMATYYENKNEFEKTIPIYRNNYQFYGFEKNAFRKINAGISLSNSMIETNNLTLVYLILAETSKQQDSVNYNYKVINQQYLFQTWAKYYSAKKDFEEAAFYERQTFDLLNKSTREKEVHKTNLNRYLVHFAEQRANQKIAFEIAARKKGEENYQLKVWVFILAGLGALSIFLAIWVRQRNARKLEISKSKQLVQEKKLVDLELEFKKKDLVDLTLSITQKQEWAKGIQDQLKLIQSSKGNKRSAEFKRLNEQVRAQILMEKELKVFNENIDTLNAEYYLKLKSKFPKLTKSETQLCSFIKLNLTNAQICQLKNIDPKSVIVMRYRLKKNLGLTVDENLDDFVKGI